MVRLMSVECFSLLLVTNVVTDIATMVHNKLPIWMAKKESLSIDFQTYPKTNGMIYNGLFIEFSSFQ